MKFNEWITQNKQGFEELSHDLGMETQTQDNLIENQLDQWVNKLVGLLHTIPPDKKQKLLEKVINSIQKRI